MSVSTNSSSSLLLVSLSILWWSILLSSLICSRTSPFLLVSAEEKTNTRSGDINVTSPVEGSYPKDSELDVKWDTTYSVSNPYSTWVIVRIFEKNSDGGRDHMIVQEDHRYTDQEAKIKITENFKSGKNYYVKVVLSHEVYGTSEIFTISDSATTSTATSASTDTPTPTPSQVDTPQPPSNNNKNNPPAYYPYSPPGSGQQYPNFGNGPNSDGNNYNQFPPNHNPNSQWPYWIL